KLQIPKCSWKLSLVCSLTSAVASFGAAGVPMLGPASTVLILTAVGLPARDVSILMAFEWFIDHFATMVNVLGDCFGMGVISHLCRNELKNLADDTTLAKVLASQSKSLNSGVIVGEGATLMSKFWGRRILPVCSHHMIEIRMLLRYVCVTSEHFVNNVYVSF
uniref:Amino acid transporter n=1 Tax=Poecilia mexicana TaxID=48701 RepID=A0A3B3XDU4_9TELE